MNYELYQGEDGIIMELTSLRGIAELMNNFGEYGNDERATLFCGLGVALKGIAHRLELHAERADWPEESRKDQDEQEGLLSGIWLARKFREMGMKTREDAYCPLIYLHNYLEELAKKEKEERGREADEDLEKQKKRAQRLAESPKSRGEG